MNRLLNIAAKTLSVVLHPLFVPSYGVALFCSTYANAMPDTASYRLAIVMISTIVLTCLMPMAVILYQLRKGSVSDLQLSNRAERRDSYMACMAGYLVWSFLLSKMQDIPFLLAVTATGATVALLIVMLVNRWWKISAHLTGLGGFMGGFMSYCLFTNTVLSWQILIIGVCVTLLLMFARLYLHAHTPEQVCAGWLVGISCTSLPLFIAYHVLSHASI